MVVAPLAAPLRQQGLSVSVDVVWDHPFDRAIVNKAAAHDYWLVAKDTRHHNLAQRTLLTNVDWLLIRKCPVPLLLVKDRKLAAEPVVLAAVDPTNEHDKPAALDERIYTFAAELARTDRWGHSPKSWRPGQGENLWMGTRGAYSVDGMIGGWLSERKWFRPGVFPAVSRTGKWSDVGHYTQMVTRNSTRIGCAIRSSRQWDYLVCHYDPSGNIDGRPVV